MKIINQFTKKKNILLLISLFLANFYGCCPCYLEQTFTNSDKVRNEISALFPKATGDYVSQQQAIDNTSRAIDNAISENSSRNGCKTIGKIWSKVKNPELSGLYDRFLSQWKADGHLSSVFIDARKQQINKVLDELDGSEKIIKEKKQKCN